MSRSPRRPSAAALAPSPAARELVKALRDRVRFFHWELEFPDVFTELGAGFSAVVGNPPWETQKPNSKEFFSNLDPLYRAYGKQEALGVQRRLFEGAETVEHEWLAYNGDFKDRGNFVRFAAEPFGDGKLAGHEGDVSLGRGSTGEELHRKWRARRGRFAGTSDPAHPFRHQGSADLNTYKMFVEVGHALLRAGGQLGVVVPSGLYTDKGTGDLRKLLLDRCAWRWLYGFENRDQIFDIHRSFKFCVCIAEKGGNTDAIQAAFMHKDLEDWAEARGGFAYQLTAVKEFSPNSLSLLEVVGDRHLQVAISVMRFAPALGSRKSDWALRYVNDEFHITKSSEKFPEVDTWSALGFEATASGHWEDSLGRRAVPLLEGRMLSHYDFSSKGWVAGKGRGAEWTDIPFSAKRWQPQYLMGAAEVGTSSYGPLPGPRLSFKNITASTNSRTAIAAVVARVPCCDTAPFLRVEGADCADTLALAAVVNSVCFDAVMRLRLGGLHLTYHYLLESPLVPREAVRAAQLWRVASRLNFPHAWFAPEWLDLCTRLPLKVGPWRRLWAVTEHERLRLRCMLDAIVAVLYGLDRDDFAWILRDCDHPAARVSDKAFCRTLDPKGFWRVDKAQDPELRHTVLSLAAFDDLQRAITAAGSRDAGIQAFCDQHDGDGWMLPETLCLADLGLTRSVDVGTYDDRARTPQPVRVRMGERFLDWQLAQTPEESWAECERHAKAILEGAPAPTRNFADTASPASQATSAQISLFRGVPR